MTKTEIRAFISQLSRKQAASRKVCFVAPKTAHSQSVRMRLQGLVYTFKAEPANFEGWGVFLPHKEDLSKGKGRATFQGEASPARKHAYLACFPRVEMRLLRQLTGSTWLAGPVAGARTANRAQRHLVGRPVVVHLVESQAPFTQIRARFDGLNFWFDEVSPTADPRLGDRMMEALSEALPPAALRLPGMTSEDRVGYTVEYFHRFPPPPREKTVRTWMPERNTQAEQIRLETALARAGGRLRNYSESGECWLVHWTDSFGELHSSTINRRDLSVVSSGICLSGQDDKFDLTSLVGVVEGFS